MALLQHSRQARRPRPAPARAAAVTLAWLAALIAPPALAQRAADNAVTAASDAFGTAVGTQVIGLYSPTNARGFNPVQAENIRIEGFYFDQQSQGANPYLFSGSDMRVGIAAQSYAFPQPSGIADYRLRLPNESGASVVLVRGPLQLYSAELDAQVAPPGPAAVGIMLGSARDFDYVYALSSVRQAVSLIGRFQPSAGTEIVPFFGYVRNYESSETPFLFADRTHPVPFFQEQDLPTQPWTTWTWNQFTGGVIARSAWSESWSVRGALFRSIDDTETNFNDLYLGVLPDGSAEHYMDVQPARRAASYSGDLRAVRATVSGRHRRETTFTVRSRHVNRGYGGDAVVDLGATSLNDFRVLPEPAFALGAKSRDVVDQTGVGINHNEAWSGLGSLSVGLLRTEYRRVLSVPGLATTTQRTARLLPNASFTAAGGSRLTIYGSYTRGLEDSVAAPQSATNRGEPPPATVTWQADAGVRIALAEHARLLLGGFRVHKTYFGLDRNSFYTSIGDISSRGVEGSVNFAGAGGLTVVAGAVWLRPEVDRQTAELGGGASVPVGPVPRTVNLNVDYAPVAWTNWAASLQWTSLSARVETSNDLYRLPPLNTLNLGIRYGFRVLGRPGTARLDAGNITNAAGVTISPVYLVAPQLQRNYTLTLTVDL